MKKIYLATPYSSKWRIVQLWRFLMVSRAAMQLMKQGYAVYSPISHTAPISWFSFKQKHEFWLAQDWHWLDYCDELFVLRLKGWFSSFGVQKEIARARKKGIPMTHLTTKDIKDLHYFEN